MPISDHNNRPQIKTNSPLKLETRPRASKIKQWRMLWVKETEPFYRISELGLPFKFKYHDGFQLSLTSLRRIHLLLRFIVNACMSVCVCVLFAVYLFFARVTTYKVVHSCVCSFIVSCNIFFDGIVCLLDECETERLQKVTSAAAKQRKKIIILIAYESERGRAFFFFSRLLFLCVLSYFSFIFLCFEYNIHIKILF